jgi:ABC-type oligopeptide transport system substrate-binding subunit/ABC-type branched-subunit amino acid transport system substrate-binding protein
MKNKIRTFLYLSFLLFSISACNNIVPGDERMVHLANSKNDLYIGVVDAIPNATQFVNGIKMAIDEMNISGGVAGKKIIPLVYYDYNNKKTSLMIASKLSNNPDVIAVVGHFDPAHAISASILYKEAGILFISTGADLIRYGGAFIFNNRMPDMVYVDKISAFMKEENYNHVVILNDRHQNNKLLAENFYQQAIEKKMDIVFHKSFSPSEKNFRDLLSELKNETFDIIFLISRDKAASLIINQMREMDIRTPVVGTNDIDTRYFWSQTGKNAEKTIIPTNFYKKNPRKLTQDFVNSFSIAFGVDPDAFSARGYDAIKLIKRVMDKKNAYLPMILDTGIRFMETWDGVLSQYHLTRKGNISPSALFYKKFENGKIVYLKQKMKEKKDQFELVEEITLRLAVNDFSTFDPGFASDPASIDACKQLFLSLTQYNVLNCVPEPNLALSWHANEHQNVFHFHLRKNAYWTDGQPVTAHDIEWTIQRNLQARPTSPQVHQLFVLKNAKAFYQGTIKDPGQLGINVIDDYTLAFQLEYPAAHFPALAGLPIYCPLPSKIIQKWGNEWTLPEHIQNNGPYQLVYYQKDALVILRKNPQYFDAANVSIEEVRYNVIPNNLIVLSMYESNQLDIIGGTFAKIPLHFLKTVKKQPETRFHYKKNLNLSTTAFAFNIERSPVNNILMRKAIASSIDLNFITQFVAFENMIAMDSFTPPALLMPEIKEHKQSFNPIYAKKMMAEAGYEDGQRCPEIIIESGPGDLHKNIAKAVSMLLKKYLNITAKVIPRNDSKNPSGHLFLKDFSACYPDADRFLYEWYTQNSHYTHFNNENVFALLKKARQEKNSNIRKKLYSQIDDILIHKECILVPLYYDTAHYLVQPRVKGWNHMPLGGQMINQWQLEKK